MLVMAGQSILLVHDGCGDLETHEELASYAERGAAATATGTRGGVAGGSAPGSCSGSRLSCMF